MSTLEELVQQRRREIELEQLELFNKSVELFKIQLDLALGHEVVSSMDLIYFSKVIKFTTVDYKNIKASFVYNGEVYIVDIYDNWFEIWCKGTNRKRFNLTEVKDNLVEYLANIAPFHQTIN